MESGWHVMHQTIKLLPIKKERKTSKKDDCKTVGLLSPIWHVIILFFFLPSFLPPTFFIFLCLFLFFIFSSLSLALSVGTRLFHRFYTRTVLSFDKPWHRIQLSFAFSYFRFCSKRHSQSVSNDTRIQKLPRRQSIS